MVCEPIQQEEVTHGESVTVKVCNGNINISFNLHIWTVYIWNSLLTRTWRNNWSVHRTWWFSPIYPATVCNWPSNSIYDNKAKVH